jgi:hypothetical protein
MSNIFPAFDWPTCARCNGPVEFMRFTPAPLKASTVITIECHGATTDVRITDVEMSNATTIRFTTAFAATGHANVLPSGPQ